MVEGKHVSAYAEERGGQSQTETFVALRADIDNWRWAGVPFYLRTGKRLPERRTQIVIQFKPLPHFIFGQQAEDDVIANRLVIDLQPDEDISLLLMNRRPGLAGARLQALPLSLSLDDGGRRRIAYERLLLDVLADNPALFVRRDEVELAWAWIDGIAASWRDLSMTPKPYAAGELGSLAGRLQVRCWNVPAAPGSTSDHADRDLPWPPEAAADAATEALVERLAPP